MFLQESASLEDRKEFLLWVSSSFSPDTEDKKDALRILSEYYSHTDMPLNGMKSWLKKDYGRFCKGYTATVERYRIALYGKPDCEKDAVSVKVDNKFWDPSYRGPKGTWSLD